MQDNRKEFNEEEFLKKVEKAARKGSSQASFRNIILSCLPTLLIIGLLAYLIVPKINFLSDSFKNIFNIDESVEGHDLTLENHGIFGYTAVDFQDAILKDSTKLTKLEVFKQNISDVSTVQDTGLFNLAVFTRNQIITYNGSVVYTVDLSKLKASDITLDQENNIITIYIPHAQQEEINIPEDGIHFGDTEKGLLALGDIKLTAEKIYEVQAGAREKMQEKLDNDNVIEIADRMAKLAVWELYSPIVKNVAKNYSLQVEFKD